MGLVTGLLLFASGLIVGVLIGLYAMAWSTVTHIRDGKKPYVDSTGKYKILKWKK